MHPVLYTAYKIYTLSLKRKPKYFSPQLQQTSIKVHQIGKHIRLSKLIRVIDNDPLHLINYVLNISLKIWLPL